MLSNIALCCCRVFYHLVWPEAHYLILVISCIIFRDLVLCCLVLSHFISSYLMICCIDLLMSYISFGYIHLCFPCLVSSCPVLPHLIFVVSSYLVLSGLVSSYRVFSHITLYCVFSSPVLYFIVLSDLILSYLICVYIRIWNYPSLYMCICICSPYCLLI